MGQQNSVKIESEFQNCFAFKYVFLLKMGSTPLDMSNILLSASSEFKKDMEECSDVDKM